MQDYINKHPQRIDKFKLALWNLIVQWDSAGLQVQFYIPDNGTVEAYDNEDPDEVGSLGWIHDWCIRPTSVKAFYKFNLERRNVGIQYTIRVLVCTLRSQPTIVNST